MSINSSRRTGKDHLTKPAVQSQLARLKREEEEELWISGEELCTEGSSDEEDSRTPSRSYRTNKSQDSRNSSAGGGKHHWVVSDNAKNLTERYNDRVDSSKSMNSNSEENSLSSLEMANSSITESQNMRSNSSVQSDTNVSLTTDDTCSDVAQDDDDEEEEEGQGLKDSEISWKVNRGTIKLINTGANATTELDRP
ncbi:hypothetical protein KPH14_005088 [Odynerus spinipes]|uniref:Uncharacterized protein n=1 Tax=Odynerus spinipes TaxID=1348599 RepID=A0AAD9RKP0_9HYME|nr:hypothetical protein KPH14_005088 [Odynerus spinipes]